MHFEEIYRQNYQQVFRLANKIVRDEEISKDISQDIFIKLYHALSGGVQILHLQGWLYRITVNYCYNHIRDSRKVQSVQIGNATQVIVSEASMIEQEKAQRISNMMLMLKEKEQLILTLYGEGMSYSEISEASGMPFTSVGKTLTRALSKLKKLCHE